MHPLIETPVNGAALFHSHSGGFPLLLCSYVLLDSDSNDTADLDRVMVIRVTALNGGSQDEAKPLRFRLRNRDDICRFLIAIGRIEAEVFS